MNQQPSAGVFLLCVAISIPAAAGCVSPASTGRQGMGGNILLIIADDLGKDQIGIYAGGEDDGRPATPNIDRLAAEGVRFENAYSNPACSPTRATILTGRYSFRHGIGHIISYPLDAIGLPLDEVSIPEMLESGGGRYDHSQVGKWHLGVLAGQGPFDPLRQGFNWSAGSVSNIANYFHWRKQINGELSKPRVYNTTDTTDDAITRANEMREPWFLWLAYNAVHGPYHVPPGILRRSNAALSKIGKYRAMVESFDAEIGRLLSSMDADVRANTTVIFIGDNGTPTSVIKRNRRIPAKGTLNEAGINVPMIVAGPLVPEADRGAVCGALVNTTDIYATVADIAGVDLAAALPAGRRLDSFSIVPLLEDPSGGKSIRRFAYAERFRPNGPPPYDFRRQAIRDDRWKLMRETRPNRNPAHNDRLFDLAQARRGNNGKLVGHGPGDLSGEALDAYERLAAQLEAMTGP